MFCENYFCIYENDNKCHLTEVSLDIQGKCQSCIYVDIDDKLLKGLKEKMLESCTD